MAPPCAKYQYIVTPHGPKIVPVQDSGILKDEESPADYNSGGYLPVKLKDSFKDGRYIVIRKLGWGHFSTVWLVNDIIDNKHSALKVVKSAGRYAETARDEIKLLRKVMTANPLHPGHDHVVSLLDSFQHCAPEDIHVCIVFEPLGENLLALIERNNKTGIPVALVKLIAKQLLLGLQYLHDECDLVHTDIKPENIMIAIPDIESHIQVELASSPSPTSRKVNIPPKSRAGVAIPRRSGGREKHVQIFDSQPLSSPFTSPVPSASSSPSQKSSLQMSRIQSAFTSPGMNKSKTFDSVDSDSSIVDSTTTTTSSSLSVGSMLVSSPVAAAEITPPTSIGSTLSALSKLSVSTPDAPTIESPVSDHNPLEQGKPSSPIHAGPSGISLLSQTAPHNNDNPKSVAEPSSHPPDIHAQLSPLDTRPFSPPPISIKIADLGNATPSKRHFTEDIQTRQYRSLEAILGRSDWAHTVDVWSVACVVFELLTAEYLFDPQSQTNLFSKDDDHMALIIELLGDFSMDLKMGGRYSRELFDSKGQLRHIRNLKPWPLERVMVEKYMWNEAASTAFCSFVLPMLELDWRKRAHAKDLVGHEWLNVEGESFDFSW